MLLEIVGLYVSTGQTLQGQLEQCLALLMVLISELGFLRPINTQSTGFSDKIRRNCITEEAQGHVHLYHDCVPCSRVNAGYLCVE